MSQDPLMDMLYDWRRGLCGCRVVSSGIHTPHCAAGNVSDRELEDLAYLIDEYLDDVIEDSVAEELELREKGQQHHETSPGQTSDTGDANAGVHREGEAPAPDDGQHEEAPHGDDGEAGTGRGGGAAE